MQLIIIAIAAVAFILFVIWLKSSFQQLPNHVIAEKRPAAVHKPSEKPANDGDSLPVEGTWLFQSADNFEPFLVALGVKYALRQMAKCSRPTEIICRNDKGEGWSIHNIMPLKKLRMDFVLGREFFNTEADGRKVNITVTLDPKTGILTETQRNPETGEVGLVVHRQLEDENTMLITMETKNVVNHSKYSRVEEAKKEL